MLTALALAASLAVAPQAAAPASPPQGLSGLANATPSPDCGGMREAIGATSAMQCVTAPLEQVSNLALTLAGDARRNGWTVSTGAANALWLVKPSTDGLCERMLIIGFWDFRAHPEPRAGIPGFVGVSVEPGQSCDAPTITPDTSAPATAQ